MPEMQPADPKSRILSSRPSRVVKTFAVIGVLSVLAASTIVLKAVGLIKWSILDLTESDEAPIRVRNGSLDLFILSGSQEWVQSGASGNYNIKNSKRYKDEFEVTVAVRLGATCGGAQTGTGSDVILTYNDDKSIRLQSQNQHTFVKPDTGVTLGWDPATPSKLSYAPAGFIKSIAVGNGANPTTMCSFSAANQLDHIIILNVP